MDTKTNTVTERVIITRVPEGVRIDRVTQADAYSYYSDLFKSFEGIRPRWACDWSLDRLEAAIDALHEREVEPEIPTSGDGWAFTPAA